MSIATVVLLLVLAGLGIIAFVVWRSGAHIVEVSIAGIAAIVVIIVPVSCIMVLSEVPHTNPMVIKSLSYSFGLVVLAIVWLVSLCFCCMRMNAKNNQVAIARRR